MIEIKPLKPGRKNKRKNTSSVICQREIMRLRQLYNRGRITETQFNNYVKKVKIDHNKRIIEEIKNDIRPNTKEYN